MKSKNLKTRPEKNPSQERNYSSTLSTEEEALADCLARCPGLASCKSGGYILHASPIEGYSDVYSRCPAFLEHQRTQTHENFKASLPKGLLERRLDNFLPRDNKSERARELCAKYLRGRGWRYGSGLVILGGYGAGKTHLGAALALGASESGEKVAFLGAASLRAGTFAQLDEKFKELACVALLVIDDLSNETESKVTNHRLFELLNHRYEEETGTIITSNLTLEDFSVTVGARIFERLAERSLVIDLEGVPSYRDLKREKYIAWTSAGEN